MTPRTGRRPGDSGTRDAILASARRRFADDGYRGATIRAIARDARVDPALVHHFFGTKQDLFAAVVDFPVSPEVVQSALAAATRADIGERIIRTFLLVWDRPEYRERMQILTRSAISDDSSARMFREFIVGTVLGPAIERFESADAELRANLVATQLVGMGFVRYLLRMEPLASASTDHVVAWVGPTVQRYITGKLD